MFRLNRQAGCVLILLSLMQAGQAAPFNSPFSRPLSLQQPALLPNTIVQPATLIRPVLTAVTPVPCVSQGNTLVLFGHNLGSQGRSQLVMDSGTKQLILAVLSWTASRITSRLPQHFNHHGKVEIGIRSGRTWLGTPLPVTICQGQAANVLAIAGIAPAPALIERSSIPPVPVAIHNRFASGRTGTSPVTTGRPDTATVPVEATQTESYDDSGWDNSADNVAQTPAAQTSGGDLLGAPLPPVPESLNLVKTKKGHQLYRPHELIAVTASMADAKRLAQVMQSYQSRIIRRRKLASLGMVMSTFRLPDQTSVAETLKAVRQQYPDLWMDLNHYFHPLAVSGQQRQSLYHAIGWQAGQACGRGLRVGILDGPVDMSQPALSGQHIVQKQLFTHGRSPAPVRHATAVASLLVGNPAVAGLGGVINEASLSVGVVMQAGKDKEVYSTAENLLSGLNWLLSQHVQVVSLSLGGSRNALLEVALQRTLALKVGVVAAAGNGGSKAPPSYPAAQTGVVAVTAVDSDSVVAGDANHGDYIDLAAPGVDVWVAAAGGGGRFASGSSMAAPLVAAALARLGGKPAQAAQLFQQAHDLGAPGKDPIYGQGLLQFPACSEIHQ